MTGSLCYDRGMKSRSVTATEFKAKCLAILDEVDENKGTVVTITKRGRPVATVQAAKKSEWRSLEGVLAGKIDLDAWGDIVSPRTDIHWDALDGVLDPPARKRAIKPRKSA
jgi:prevent-host-death family protein